MSNMNHVKLFGPKGEVVLDSLSKRNMVYSTPMQVGMPTASFDTWSVKKAVKDGLKSSVWVYRADNLIAQSASIVKMMVTDKDNKPVDNHSITQLLTRPNPQISRKDMFHLVYMWLNLAGLGYFQRVTKGKTTTALWPMSPDRILPIRSKKIDAMIDGYSKKEAGGGGDKQKIDYKPEEIIAFRLMDPSNPIKGVSPLLASSKIVDTDTEQQKFNKSAMQNRGVVEGLVSFKQPLTQEQMDAQVEAWKERNAGSDAARSTAFIGGEAKYTRFSMTPAEMDFIRSRKTNRDEILAAHGVPPQLVGAQESSTYNNFRVAEIVLWRMSIVPLIDLVADQLTFSFRMSGEINDDQKVSPDYSEVHALQQNYDDKTKSAERMFKMGIPVKEINRVLHMNLQQYNGWEDPYNGKDVVINPATGNTTQGTTEGSRATVSDIRSRPTLKPLFVREKELTGEFKIKEDMAKARSKEFADLLSSEQDMVQATLEANGVKGGLVELKKLQDTGLPTREEWMDSLQDTYIKSALKFGKDVTIEGRAFEDELEEAVTASLNEESTILIEASGIEATTVTLILEQVSDGLANGLAINQIMEAIGDTGVFSPERALMIARTTVGTGASMGQWKAAQMSGAGVKVWHDSGFEVRELHQKRNNERAPIDGEFTKYVSPNGAYPRYPLDPNLHASDRINCRCVMTFE